MGQIAIPGAHTFYVRWSCRRCGFERGAARTTIPLPGHALNEVAVRNLFEALRHKLIKKHFALHGCVASSEDLRIEKGQPEDMPIVGTI